jgi:hypothetical protein
MLADVVDDAETAGGGGLVVAARLVIGWAVARLSRPAEGRVVRRCHEPSGWRAVRSRACSPV